MPGRVGPLGSQPAAAELEVGRAGVGLAAERVERGQIARCGDAEAQDAHARDVLLAGRVVVGPRPVVERARGQHRHVDVVGEQLGEPAALLLGPAADLRPVARDDERDPHPIPPTSSSRRPPTTRRIERREPVGASGRHRRPERRVGPGEVEQLGQLGRAGLGRRGDAGAAERLRDRTEVARHDRQAVAASPRPAARRSPRARSRRGSRRRRPAARRARHRRGGPRTGPAREASSASRRHAAA